MKLEISNLKNDITIKFTIIFAIITIISSILYLLWDINIPGLSAISLSLSMLSLSFRYIHLYKINKMKFNLFLSIFLFIVFASNLYVGINSIKIYILFNI